MQLFSVSNPPISNSGSTAYLKTCSCLPCGANTYSTAGSTSCTGLPICERLSVRSVFSACSSGQWSLPGSSSCTGTVVASQMFIDVCAPAASSPQQCPAGTSVSYNYDSCALAFFAAPDGVSDTCPGTEATGWCILSSPSAAQAQCSSGAFCQRYSP